MPYSSTARAEGIRKGVLSGPNLVVNSILRSRSLR